MAAILDGDCARASATLRAHVTIEGERFGDLVASLERLQSAFEMLNRDHVSL